MHHSGISNKVIKRRLASRDPRTRQYGICLLFRKFFKDSKHDIRVWGVISFVFLTEDDIEVIRQMTFASVTKYLASGHFKKKGNLKSMIKQAMEWRASDFVEKRTSPTERNVVFRPPEIVRRIASTHDHRNLLNEEIVLFCRALRKKPRTVLLTDVRLFYESYSGGSDKRKRQWPPLLDLTDEVNSILKLEEPLTPKAVNSLRRRTRARLRYFLERRGWKV